MTNIDQRVTLMEITRKDTSAFEHLTDVCYEYKTPTEHYDHALRMALNGLHTHKKVYGKESIAIIGRMKRDKDKSIYQVFIKKK